MQRWELGGGEGPHFRFMSSNIINLDCIKRKWKRSSHKTHFYCFASNLSCGKR